jgi:tetratricopeptide (TPR) repeat protein
MVGRNLSEKYSMTEFSFPIYEAKGIQFKINWKLYPDFKIETEPILSQGIYHIHFQSSNFMQINDIPELAFLEITNPYPKIVITSIKDNTKILIPAHRILSVDNKIESLMLQFMPHRQNPIRNLPENTKCMWGIAYIEANSEVLAELFEKLNTLVYFDDLSPRPRCSYCQGLKSIGLKHEEETYDEFDVDNLVCSDCFYNLIQYIQEFKKYWEIIKEKTSSEENRKIYNLTEKALSLTADFPEVETEFYIVLTKALTILKSHYEIEEKESFLRLMDQISLSLENNPNESLLELKTRIDKLNPEKLSKPIEEFGDNDLINIAFDLLNKAKAYEEEEKFEAAIDAIDTAAEPLVDLGIWGENELQKAKNDIERLKKLHKGESILPETPKPNDIENREQLIAMEKMLRETMILEEDKMQGLESEKDFNPDDLIHPDPSKSSITPPKLLPIEKISIPKVSIPKVSIPKFKKSNAKSEEIDSIDFIDPIDSITESSQIPTTATQELQESEEENISELINTKPDFRIAPDVKDTSKVIIPPRPAKIFEKSESIGSIDSTPKTEKKKLQITFRKVESSIPKQSTDLEPVSKEKINDSNAADLIGKDVKKDEDDKNDNNKEIVKPNFILGVRKKPQKPKQLSNAENIKKASQPILKNGKIRPKLPIRRKKPQQKVIICPMCGKVSKECDCGYMKA